VKRYVLSQEAEGDLIAIKSYLLEKAGIEVSRYVMQELRSSIRLLAKTPRLGHRRSDLTDENVLFWPVYSYLIVYDPDPQPIEVVRILHGSRDIADILDR